jgi:hypothetical protein
VDATTPDTESFTAPDIDSDMFLCDKFQDDRNNIEGYLEKGSKTTMTPQAPRMMAPTVMPQAQTMAMSMPPKGKCTTWCGMKYNKMVVLSIQDYYDTPSKKRRNTCFVPMETYESMKCCCYGFAAIIYDQSVMKQHNIV